MRAKFINESMGYNFLGKEVSHEDARNKQIRDHVTDIIVEERGISEKAFESYDNVIDEVKRVFDANPDLYERAEKYYQAKKRFKKLAEEIYEEYFNENS